MASALHTPLGRATSACHQTLPFIESSLVTFCCEHLCMSLASCENLLSHFSPPQGAIKVASLSCRILQSLFARSSGKNNVLQWHFSSSYRLVPWKEISPGCSLEGMMLKLKLQYLGHLMRRVDSLEKTLMLGEIGGRRRRGRQRTRWLDGITNSMFSCSVSQSLSRIRLFMIPWTAAHQASLTFTISLSLFKLMSSQWRYPTISSSVTPSCLQSFPAFSAPMCQWKENTECVQKPSRAGFWSDNKVNKHLPST